MDEHRVDYQDNKILQATNIAKTWGKKTILDQKCIEPDRYQAGYVVGNIEWLDADLKNNVTKRGKHDSDKEDEGQVLYRKFKKRALKSEI